ncbi:MAG: tetratricopeptide repeat protein [Thermoplasmata archaeon]
MKGRWNQSQGLDKFTQIRIVKNVLFGLLIISVLVFSGYLVFERGFSTDPLFIPLDSVLNLLLLAVVLLSLLNIVFKALELKYAQREGQKFLIADSSWKGAKRAFGLAIIIVLVLIVPTANAMITNLLSRSVPRTLDVGETYPFSFTNQDLLGITEAKNLHVVVQNGFLKVTIAEDGSVVNPGGTNLTAGQQQSFPLDSSRFLIYTVTFENNANASTSFTFRVNIGFPEGLTSLVVILSAIVATANLAWMAYLRPRRGKLSQQPPYPQPPLPPAHAMPRMPATPAERPWYELHGLWHSVYTPWRSVPTRGQPREQRTTVATTQELPPPPPQVEPYEVEVPPPPPEEPLEDSDRALLREVSVDIPALLERAEERVATGEYQEALEDYDTVLHFDASNLRALLKKAELLRRLQRIKEALECLDEALQVDPWHHQGLLRKGRLLEEEGRYDDALECYEAVLQGGPQYFEALIRKGDIMVRMEEPELALGVYEEALRLKPGDRELEEKIRFLEEQREHPVDRARREIEAGNIQKAEEFLRRALDGDRGEEAQRWLTDLYLRQGREEEALQILDQSIEADPDDLKLILRRLKALVRIGRLADALDACERACEVAPEEAAVWAIKGSLEVDLGLEGKAVESLERALELNPDDAESRKRLDRLQHTQHERGELEELLLGMEELPEEAVDSILGAFGTIKELKGAKVKVLTSLEGVTDDVAKRVLKRVRKGR